MPMSPPIAEQVYTSMSVLMGLDGTNDGKSCPSGINARVPQSAPFKLIGRTNDELPLMISKSFWAILVVSGPSAQPFDLFAET